MAGKLNMNGFFAVAFLVVWAAVNIFCIVIIKSGDLPENAYLFIGGLSSAINAMLLLIVQFYFRTRPPSKPDETKPDEKKSEAETKGQQSAE